MKEGSKKIVFRQKVNWIKDNNWRFDNILLINYATVSGVDKHLETHEKLV